jgi:diacylglycerol kinase (ATP)
MNSCMLQKKKEPFSFSKRLKSFRHAFNGIRLSFIYEHNMRVHLAVALLTIGAGFFLHITRGEWMAIVFAIGFVFSTELLNSAIEGLADFILSDHHPAIGKIKDIAAAAVLIAVIAAVIIGLMVFVPHLFQMVKHF